MIEQQQVKEAEKQVYLVSQMCEALEIEDKEERDKATEKIQLELARVNWRLQLRAKEEYLQRLKEDIEKQDRQKREALELMYEKGDVIKDVIFSILQSMRQYPNKYKTSDAQADKALLQSYHTKMKAGDYADDNEKISIFRQANAIVAKYKKI